MNTTLLFAVFTVAQPPPIELRSDDAILRWNEATLAAIKAEGTPPPLAARNLAMVHVAMFDAVNAVRKKHHPFRVEVQFPGPASAEAAASMAAHRVLVGLYPSRIRQFDRLLNESFDSIPDSREKERGIALGRFVGREIAESRTEDGAVREVRYTPGKEPGNWNPTPPAFARPLAPQWPRVKCFVLDRGSQFRAGGPPALNSDAYKAAFEEVRGLGSKTSSTRTREQTLIALFWADGEGTVTPPGHWNHIAQTVSRQRGLGLAENARLFALLNVAMADVGIACWDCKFHFNFWRPIQAIREVDPDWEPLLPTPPFPAYTSGHSSFSSAAATILAGFFENDAIRFATTSDSLPSVTRRFDRFSDAADEAGMSRIYGGIHWQFDNVDGLAGGRKIARHVLENSMKPK